jgi:hypothetical protein
MEEFVGRDAKSSMKVALRKLATQSQRGTKLVLFLVFLIVFVVSLAMGGRRRRP